MKKGTILIIFLILLGAIICLNVSDKKEIQESDSVFTFFDIIEQEKGVEFLNYENALLEWKVVDENDEIQIARKNGKCAFFNTSDLQNIDSFFEENGFELDIYNLADSPHGSMKGYKKDRMYCIIKEDQIVCAIMK